MRKWISILAIIAIVISGVIEGDAIFSFISWVMESPIFAGIILVSILILIVNIYAFLFVRKKK